MGTDQQPPVLLIDERAMLLLLGSMPDGAGLQRANVYKALTSGAHYFTSSVVISPYDKSGQWLLVRDCSTPSTSLLELSLLVCGPC